MIDRRHVSWLGITVHPMKAVDVVSWIRQPSSGVRLLLNHNLHSLLIHRKAAWFRTLYSRADRTIIDGWPVLAAVNHGSAEKLSSDFRIGSTDWLQVLAAEPSSPSNREMNVFVLGANAVANTQAIENLSRGAHLNVIGRDGYFDIESDGLSVVESVRQANPDLVLIGMGMPRQEEFLARYFDTLPPAVYATVGGAVDYLAGTSPLSPRILGRLRLEWLWRFAHSPKRLFGRYFVEPFELVARTAIANFDRLRRRP